MILLKEKIKEQLMPYPRYLELGDGVFNNASDASVRINATGENKLSYLLSLCGFSGSVQYEPIDSQYLILSIGTKTHTFQPIEPELKEVEAYALDVTENSISISARSINGIGYALKTLAKIKHIASNIPVMQIQDAPEIEFRTVHLCIFNPNDGTEKEATAPDDIKRMIKLAAMSGYNHVMLEFWGMFPYEKHPYATWPNKLYSREVVDGIISYAIDNLFITPLPCQNLTSHAGWSRIDSRKHVVLDQRPDLADMWIPGGWCFATENPDTKDYLKDIMSELLDTFRNPPFLHACCDKAFGFGSNEKDRTKSADILFGSHLCFLNTFLQERSTRMIMWSDMLYSSMDALYWKNNPALVDVLPRNILMNIWTHNDPGTHWGDPEFFESKGFQTIYSPWINKKGVDNMIDICNKRGSYGIMQTTWHLPQTATDSVAYSGAAQWNSNKLAADIEQHLSKWYNGH